jgi:hypothetical protein
MRVNRQQVSGHPDNRGIVVSHIGPNLDRHWDDFKTLDAEDQQLVHAWLMGEERRPAPAREADERRPLMPDMVVRYELTLDRFLGEQFLEISDEDLPDRVLEALSAQGIDPLRLAWTVTSSAPARHPHPGAHRPSHPSRFSRRPTGRRASTPERAVPGPGRPDLRRHRPAPAGRKLAATGVGGATNDLAAVIILVNQARQRVPRHRLTQRGKRAGPRCNPS